jgi:hypothetical protein
MIKKIIIKESQYNRVVLLLKENVNIKNLLSSVTPNKTLNIINDLGDENKIKVDRVENGKIYGKDLSNVYILIDINNYDESTNELIFQKLNPNTNSFIDSVIKVSNVEILDGEEGDEDGVEYNDEDNELFKKYYQEILNDPNLKKALYTAPTLWNYFMSALKDKKARGTGILPAYDLINKYLSRRTDEKLPGFTDKENKRALFFINDNITIEYYTLNDNKRKVFNLISDGQPKKATVRQYEAGLGDVKVLSYRSAGGSYGFKIVVKKPTGDRPDEFWCDIYVNNNNVEENKYKQENIRVKFLNSDGYTSYDKLKKNK